MSVEQELTGKGKCKGKGKGNVRLTAETLDTFNVCAAYLTSEHARRQPWAARQSALALEPSWVQRERDRNPAVCAGAKANAKSSPKANAKTAPTSKAKAAPPTAHYRQPHAAATWHGQPSAASSSASSSMNNGPLVTLPWQQFGPQHQERLAMTPAPRYSECYANEAADLDDGGNESQRHSAALALLDAAQAAEAGAEVEPAVGGKEIEPSLGGT